MPEITRPKSLWGRHGYGIEQTYMMMAGKDAARAAFLIKGETLTFAPAREFSTEIINEMLRTGKMSHEFKAMTAKRYLSKAIQSLDNIGV